MKKMIFSAVALVAFSFAGMANEVKEKKGEVKPTETKKVEILEEVKEKDCFLEAIYEYDLAEMMGANEYQATAIMNMWYAICSGYTMGDINDGTINAANGF